MPTLYCPADGAGPRECPDWSALYRACTSDVELAAVDDLRAAEPGHIAQNGNGPRTSTMGPSETAAVLDLRGVVLGSDADAFGGFAAYVAGSELVGRQLLCPVCMSPVRQAP